MQTIQQETEDGAAETWWRGHRLALLPWITLLVVMSVAVVTYLLSNPFPEEMHQGVDVLASGDHQRIREYLRGYGAWGPVVSIFLMTAQVVFAPIPASVVQLANGVVYGPLWGTLLNIAGQMAGAMLAFGIARSLGKGMVEKLIGRINGNALEGWLDRWGGKALFVIRAIPGTPSDFISYLAGLTNMRRRTYVLATFLGYIPQSLLFAWLGDTAMGWFWWIVVAGFVVSSLIGLVGWVIQRRSSETGRRRLRPRASATCI